MEETEQRTRHVHKVNLCVAHKVCRHCYEDQKPTPDCLGCGEKIFYGLSALDDFCVWLFNKRNKDAICFAHNAQGQLFIVI